jgi:hypothetical protein
MLRNFGTVVVFVHGQYFVPAIAFLCVSFAPLRLRGEDLL